MPQDDRETEIDMDDAKLRAWWWQKQGLDGSLRGAAPAAVLERSGWARSVGGAGPYLTLFARARTSREEADAAVQRLDIHELPAARGCTYVLPARDFALALTVAEGFGRGELRTAEKLGVTENEVDTLCAAVVKAVGDHVSWLVPGDHVVFSFIPSCGLRRSGRPSAAPRAALVKKERRRE